MNKKVLTLIVLSICIIMTSCAKQKNGHELEISAEAFSLVESYMEACKVSAGESVKYVHFENDFKKEAYINSGDKLVDYRIESSEIINDNLYEFTILVRTTQTGNDYLRVYNFIALIDNEWYFINGIGNIPANLKDNLDEGKYSYE